MLYVIIAWVIIAIIIYKLFESGKIGPWTSAFLGAMLAVITILIMIFSKDDK